MASASARALAMMALGVAASTCAPSSATLDRLYEGSQWELRRGRLDEALANAEQGANRARRAEDAVRALRFRLLAADVRITKGEFAEALAILEEPLPDGADFRLLRGRQLLLTARARVAQGQLKAAEPLAEQAMPLAGDDTALLLDIDLLRSQLLYRSGRAAEADALLAAARTRVAAGQDFYRLAQVSNNLGLGLVTRGRFDEALPYFESILNDREVQGTTVQGAALNNAGLCHARLGQFERAIALQRQAIQVQQQGRKRDYAQALGEMGSTYLLQDDYARSTGYLQQAFNIAAEAGLASDAALFARNLAAAFVALNRWDDAARFNREAARFAQGSGPASPYALVTDAKIAAGRGRSDEAERLFGEALAVEDAAPGVRWMSHEGLARLALSANRPSDAARHFESALQTVDRTRSALLRADDRISFTSRLTQFYRGYVDLLLSQDQVERALEIADASRARVLAERQGVSTPTARATGAALRQLARKSDSTLLFYWLGTERSWVWTVTGERISATALPPAAQIDALVDEHQAAIQNGLTDPLIAAGSAGERLYVMVVQPVEHALGGQVVIVPDGALHRVNFETLLVPEGLGGRSRRPADGPRSLSRHYWIDDVTLQIAPSLAMLQASSVAVPGSASLLLVGNAAARPPEFPALTHAAAEMSAIRKSFAAGSVSVLDAERASPAAFKAAAPERFSVIHFTSHAIANTESPLDSAVILSGPDQAYKLYARDIAALPLHAELVTVSACRSAGERAYAGEGLVGFAWAFLRAGSLRVVAGLWDVDDRSTAALMEEVYARLAAGAPPAAALREAKRALLHGAYPKPYYWAPFQLFTVVI